MPPSRRGKRFQDLAERLGLKGDLEKAAIALDKHRDALSWEEGHIIDYYYRKSDALYSDNHLAEEMQVRREDVTDMRHEALERIRLLIRKEG